SIGIEGQRTVALSFTQTGSINGFGYSRYHLRAVLLHFLQQSTHAEAEHSGIPQVITSVHVFGSGGQVGLFDKAVYFKTVAEWSRLVGIDVTKARFRSFWLNAKGDQPAFS